MTAQRQLKKEPKEPEQSITLRFSEDTQPVGLMPPSFPPEYVAGSIVPFFLAGSYVDATPSLPMIDLTLTKQGACPVHLWGMFYEGWVPNPEEEGTTVFLTGYERRGPNNARKKIYMTATTPDLIDTKYRAKIKRFYERFLANANAGQPMMAQYFDNYYDLYWDLHVGATGEEIPTEVRHFSAGFNTVLGFYYPTLDIVRDAYMQARNTRETLKAWLDTRVQAIEDDKQPNADSTFVYYWLKNGELGENFRRMDIVFECFHNFLAFSQWGNIVYNVAAKLEPTHGDPVVQKWFEKTMIGGPDTADDSPFTPLDRFVMELFRTINPNAGSLSTLKRGRQLLASEFSSIATPHLAASMDPRHWEIPTQFDPDRYKTAPTSADNDECRVKDIGLARCPFSKEAFPVRDGRKVEMTNSAFGAVYSEIEAAPHPVVDTAGYAPFGFGYRRCAGEHLTVEFVKEFLRKVWSDKISFVKLDARAPGQIPVNPRTVLNDDIAFRRSR
jgi:cytochrome P450